MPLFKKGDPSIVGSYRPISLTSTLCKVMETIIKDNLLSHALSNNIINHNQHGFIQEGQHALSYLKPSMTGVRVSMKVVYMML